MEITNFLTSEMIMTWTITLLCVELLVSCTKGLPLIRKIPTQFYMIILSVIHLAIINIEVGLFAYSVVGIYVMILNAVVISTILSGGYKLVTGKITIAQEDTK